ncbi:MAG TPA: M4 family metallopeptidase [Chitinophagales bacterium]|nr:M4 family metallopeptidase [Chitinophagales bacterium]
MKIFLPIIALILLCFFSSAQESNDAKSQQVVAGSEQMIMQPGTSIPQLMKFRRGSEMDFKSFEIFLKQHYKSSGHFGIKLMKAETDRLGFTHYRYQQTFDGIPVEGTMYIVHVRNGKIETMNGLFFDHLSPAVAHVSESAALDKALAVMPASRYRWQIPDEEKMLREETHKPDATWFPKGELMYAPVNGIMDAESFRLTYRFDIFSVEPLSRKYVYVDAGSGDVIHTQDRIENSDVVGTAITAYSGTQSITADSFNGSYRLREAGRGLGIETYNLNHSTSNYSGAADFTDADNYWNNVNGNQDQYATDAHWGAEAVYDFYQSFFGRNSIDGNGFKLKSYVHYSTSYLNAFWDGSEMTYGDGSAGYTPLTTMDICGHEISHGLTEFTSNLTYSYESGALNESFSDCMGNAMEFWKKPGTASWLVGEEIGGGGFRSMSDPHSYGDPDTYLGTYWYSGSSDNGGVHTNSSVMNHWFYIVSVGEAGTNDNNVSYTIGGITIAEAQAILFRANTVYFTPSTNYSLARQYTIQAATDLYGGCSNEVQVVTNAWNAVGVGAAYTATVTAGFYANPTVFCSAPTTVAFTNTSTNAGTFNWSFGDGGTSTLANPTHTYQNYGVYTVKLVASSSCGTDSITLNNYINISASNACTVTMPQNGYGQTQTACAGVLYDSGGPSGNYQDNTASQITISPTGASNVQLSFTSFNMESGYDFLYVFDGPSDASPVIATLTGNYLPALIVSSGPSVTIGQYSDPGLTFSGYEIHWQCSNASVAPVAAFTSDYTSTCSGIISFTDQSLNVPTSWQWNFGDGFTSSSQNPSHTYATSGTYSVTLTATNASGSNALTKTNYISVSKSAGPSTTGASVCNSGSVTLQASGGGTLNWYDAAAGGNFVNTGISYVTPSLNVTTNYYVEAVTAYSQQGVGPANNSIGSSSSFDNSTDRYLIFDCLAAVKLVSVRVFASGADVRTIELRNSSNAILKSKVVYMDDGEQVITLNWDIPVATGLHLGIGGPAYLQRNTSGASYPYTLSGVVSITGNNAQLSGYYYYFYDWKLQQPTCISQRSTVTATVIQVTAAITPGGSTSICPGGSVVLNANTGGGLSYQWKLNGSSISGATLSSYTASSAGDYTVVVTQNGCSATSSAVTVTVTQVTATITPGGSVSICPGSSVMLNANTGGGLSYQWKLNGSTISGATSSSYIASSAGDYTVVVSQNGCSATSSAVTVTVTQVTATITPGGPTSICSGSFVVLNANTGGGLTYQWLLNSGAIEGATASSFSASQAGDYTVEVALNGCRSTSSAVTISIISAPSVSITSPGTSICKGTSMTLTVSPSGFTYQWTKNGTNISGATALTYSTTKSGNYACKVTYQCGTITSNTIALTQNLLPTATITPSGTVTICSGSSITLQANTGNLSYQWQKSLVNISGATNSSLVVTAKGNYKVVVTDNATGCSKASAATKVTVQACKPDSEGEDVLQHSLTVYPNPTSGDVTISVDMTSTVDEEGAISVKNLLGQVAYSTTVLLQDGGNEFILHLSDLDSGIYLLELRVGERIYVTKVMIGK